MGEDVGEVDEKDETMGLERMGTFSRFHSSIHYLSLFTFIAYHVFVVFVVFAVFAFVAAAAEY